MFHKIWYMFFIFLGTLIIISSNSWIIMWMGLEINLLGFIPMIMNMNNINSNESMLIYFIFQSIASMLFLFSTLLYLNMKYFFMMNNWIYFFIIISLMMKIGSVPFHFWIPLVMKNLNWMNNFILMTWQKIGPMMMLSYSFKQNYFYLFIILSSIISAMMGINQTNLKILMAYSSINQISWMLISLMINEFFFKMYLSIYVILILNLILLFNFKKLNYISQIFSLKFKNMKIKILIFMELFSIGGLPPFLGFFPKLVIMKNLILMNMNFILFIMVMFNCIILFFYIRILYSSFLFYSIQMKKFIMNNNIFFSFNFMIMFNFLNNLMLIFIFFIYMI